MIILNTNVVSEPLRPQPDPGVVAWLDAQAIETLFLTSITLAEIRYGIAALPSGKRRGQLQARFEDDVVPVFDQRILDFDEAASAAYGDLRARARSRGTPIGDFDALIASIATANSFTVATRDTAPFRAADVPVIDPFAVPDP